MTERLSLETARSYLDFAAGAKSGVVSEAVAEEQLQGAVAIHNMLHDHGVAYLADEVGMGKTYVALGAMALLRHFQPRARIMVIAPKQNIQDKWIREWKNFVSQIVTVEDLAVKAIGGHPARALVKVDSLVDLMTEVASDPDRDWFLRLTSFSLSKGGAEGTVERRRDRMLRTLPWLDKDLLDARGKHYKRNFARAVNCALPDIDLLIVDEAHNLKAGWREGASSAVRNMVLGCALAGRPIEDDNVPGVFKGYSPRVKRVLLLSATPIEYDVRQLWNQLDLFGFGEPWRALREPEERAGNHREVIQHLLIRRTAQLRAAGRALTKTEYRREWRAGGIGEHDHPLAVNGDRQRLAVALMQKKVAELLGRGSANHSFQVGLLASFESYLETIAGSLRGGPMAEGDEDEVGIFHRTAEEAAATRNDSREGIDISTVNAIAKDHRRVFQREMPHPKMDAIVNELARSFETGRKALVFVRRVASVDELQRKLEERYDDLLFGRLRNGLNEGRLREELGRQISDYGEERSSERATIRARDASQQGAGDNETSSVESFFAWFFRGDGPKGVRSGASIAADMGKRSSAYVTLLEDNHVAALLDVPTEDVCRRFAEALAVPEPEALAKVAQRAAAYIGIAKRDRLGLMHAVQGAALGLLREAGGEIGVRATVILQEVFPDLKARGGSRHSEVDAAAWLAQRTLFSELRKRPALRAQIWPASTAPAFPDAFREQEVRREYLSTMVRKGHPIIDLFVLIANRVGTITAGARERGEGSVEDLASEFLDLLGGQSSSPNQFSSWYELHQAASRFEQIVQLNLTGLMEEPLSEATRVLGSRLRAQRPVAGMAGKVNGEVVRQFRMPGYPLVLITTDLLKEGEDLHLFCSNVYHYGIAWMPSELEQRVGRIDRVGSQTERRLAACEEDPCGDDLLQVFYPHLRDTVELLQLNRVYERLNRFVRMMHEGLGAPQRDRADVSVAEEGLRNAFDVAAIREPLRSAFLVTPTMLRGAKKSVEGSRRRADHLHERFAGIERLVRELGAQFTRIEHGNQIVGEMPLRNRVQPFTLFLRAFHGHPVIRGISPVGRVDTEEWSDDDAADLLDQPFVRISLELNQKFEAYDVSVEGDIMLGDAAVDEERVKRFVHSLVSAADRLERSLLMHDRTLVDVAAGIAQEPAVAR